MTRTEYEQRKADLEEKIDNAKTAEEIEEIKTEVEALKNEEVVEETEVKEDERSLLKESLGNVEVRNLKEVTKKEEEKEMEEKNILETEEYRSAFMKKLQGVALNEAEERAMTSAQNSVGRAIPTTTLNRIDELLRQTSALYNEVEVLNISGYLSIPKELVTNDASWVAEDTASSDVNDTLSAVSFAAYKLIRTIDITAEVEAMTVDAFETYIVKKMSDKMKIAIENAILNGTGLNQPKGILAETLEEITTDSISYANMCSLMANLKAGYKPNAKFVLNSKTLWNDVAQITADGKPLFIADPTGTFAGRIFGKPVIEDEYISDGKVLLGDFTKYTLNFNKPIEITSDDSVGFRKGNKCYRGMALLDGKTRNTEAFVVLTSTESY